MLVVYSRSRSNWILKKKSDQLLDNSLIGRAISLNKNFFLRCLIMGLESPYAHSLWILLCRASYDHNLIFNFVVRTRELKLEGQRDISAAKSMQHYSCSTSLMCGRAVEGNALFLGLNRTNILARTVLTKGLIVSRENWAKKSDKTWLLKPPGSNIDDIKFIQLQKPSRKVST